MKPLVGAAGAMGMALAGLAVLLTVSATAGAVPFATGILLATLPVPVYLALSLWVDRFEPEPRSVVLFAFWWGATVAVLLALVLNTIGEIVVGETLGGGAAEIYGGSISAPVVEESAKGLALLLIYRRRREEFNGVVDGIVYAVLVGLGFAMTENVLYYSQGTLEQGVPGAIGTFIARGLLSPFAHPLFTAMTGIGFGLASRSLNPYVRSVAPAVGLAAAMILHSTWNTAAGAGYAGSVYILLFVPIFFGIVAIMVSARAREGQRIKRFLEPEVRLGVLSAGELKMLGSVRARRAAAKMPAVGGPPARGAVREMHEAATELAFHRDRVARGLAPPGDGVHGERFQAAVRELRARTGGYALA